MPPPYMTNCLNYNKIRCTSRLDCLEKCYVDWALIHCNNSLPRDAFIDKNNDKYRFTLRSLSCYPSFQTKFCGEKYKSRDCFIERYTSTLVSDKEIIYSKVINEHLGNFNKTFKSNYPNAESDIKLMSIVEIHSNDELDTIITHSPQQQPVEFICFIGGVISLWTGFSIFSIYAYGKQFFRRNQNKVESIKTENGAVNNKKRVLINKMNDKISSLQTKLNKVMKVMKIKNKNQISKITPDSCA